MGRLVNPCRRPGEIAPVARCDALAETMVGPAFIAPLADEARGPGLSHRLLRQVACAASETSTSQRNDRGRDAFR